jgi:O-6-methylguanine DNA methyltransferase
MKQTWLGRKTDEAAEVRDHAMKESVYELLKTIPRGKVATYGQIAVYLGNKNLARVVGNILHNNPDPSQYPCHRVVNSKGQVAPNFAFGGGAMQRRLLEQEGIVFEQDGSIDLKKYGIPCIRAEK